jgi:hypothetical protein
MENNTINQEKLKQFASTIDDKVQHGFVVIEKNDKFPFTVLVKEGKKVDHFFNFLICCATLGIWSLPWLYISQVSSKTRKILVAIDEDGIVFEENCYVG